MVGLCSDRGALQRASLLHQADPALRRAEIREAQSESCFTRHKGLSSVLDRAAVPLPVPLFLFVVSLIAVGAAALAAPYVNEFFLPLIAAAAASVPFQWLDSRIEKRVAEFCEDYPTLLLAASSSIKSRTYNRNGSRASDSTNAQG